MSRYNCFSGRYYGIGNVLSSPIHFMVQNSSLAKLFFVYTILGFSLIEAISSFALMIAFLI
ncbi:ATP synthase subunit 9, mitochondrial [Capsicum annuum]|uniref:ATP synthase subunit 9, mitochondrial n=1 Tax=Capsicum annuum TaxID=4072 RepID=A0A2G2Z9S8_CAPAN|nr:ATP synthase subunit 9, mitochondrial [Capsicum annuum]